MGVMVEPHVLAMAFHGANHNGNACMNCEKNNPIIDRYRFVVLISVVTLLAPGAITAVITEQIAPSWMLVCSTFGLLLGVTYGFSLIWLAARENRRA